MAKAARKSTKARGIRALTREQRTAVLKRAGRVLAEYNGGKPQCIERVAVLERAAGLLGIKAEPVPVAVAVQGPIGACMLGEAVEGVIPLLPGGAVRRASSTELWNGAGHLFLFASQEGIMLDPTLDQVGPVTGCPRGCLIMPITADHLYADDVPFEIAGGVQVLYRVVRSDSSWRTAYNAMYANLGKDGRLLARRALELEGFDEELV
ncbi:hypothetical protein [Micromonospora sp. D93]|uniref:hypothetical protein n=1 Tax=unclassified Micromonospora TaxID=2617518 RepID=UPI001B373A1D|nr:hypothetical protein [Micromonospora sp. D93]MBQ1019805.1 hypothetical protein [Micromonospora sp. D93]